MIEILAKAVPEIVRIIDYETMVADPAGVVKVAAELCGVPFPAGLVLEVDDDRGCATPYREQMAAAMNPAR